MRLKRVKSLLLNNVTLAIIIGLPFVVITSSVIKKYQVELMGPINLYGYKYIYYHDLNKDGVSDKIYFGENSIGTVFCKIYDPAHRGQFNVSGEFTENFFNTFFADINDDGYDEILFFSQKDTAQVFLNIIDCQNDEKKEYKLCTVGTPGKRDFGAFIKDFIDLNQDGQKELIIGVSAGFALQPRKIYTFNPKSGELLSTPLIGSKLSNMLIEDIDSDGYREIICGTYTYQNYDVKEDFPYDDNWTRLFIFDHNLKFKSPPLKFSNLRSGLNLFSINNGNTKLICAALDFRGDSAQQNKLYLINAEGEILESKNLVNQQAFITNQPQFIESKNNLLVIDDDGYLYRIDSKLNLHKLKHLKKYANSAVRILDLNGDGKEELIWSNNETGIITVTDTKYRHAVELDLKGNQVNFINPVFDNVGGNKYLLQSNEKHYLLSYGKSLIWNIRFIVFALIFVFFWILITLLNRIQAYKLNERLRVENQMKEMQYKVITSRLSPHYTFNVLNTFSSQIYDKENPELYDYFNKFIRQLKYLYEDKSVVTRPLNDELKFCTDYLDIQKMRFKDKFDYMVNVDPNINLNLPIPKMLMHIFVENAFKHGLRSYEKDGLIEINIAKNDDRIEISIIDNGVGRDAAKEYIKQNPQYSSGRGIEMLMEFVAMYNSGKKEKINVEIIDLAGTAYNSGTKVEITIPY